MSKYHPAWDLESLFPGGSGSPDLLTLLDQLESAPSVLREKVEALAGGGGEPADRWHEALQARDAVTERLSQARAFVGCLVSQDVGDTKAKLLMGRVQQLIAAFQRVDLLLKDGLREMPEPLWERLQADERIEPIAFQLREMREEAAELLPVEQEALIVDLSVDGHRAWERLYDTIVGRILVPWESDGRTEMLSVGQAYNRFSHPDPSVRAGHFANWTEAWAREAELCAAALNHLGGFRLTTYRHRGWNSVLARGLKANRVSRDALEAMWSAVEAAKEGLVAYLDRKAKLLGLEALSWHDEQAALQSSARPTEYDEAVEFVVGQLGRLSPRMSDFARLAVESRWVEAEDRPGKDPGGYCTRLPLSRQSRVFMTFGRNQWGVYTLAHELGHAFHNHVQWDLPPLARGASMSTAETASTYAELAVARAAREQAGSREARLALLDESLRGIVTMFMNIHARYLFEQRFYEAREKGLLGVDQLNEMMVQAQKDAYRGALVGYHPHFWASKGHFYGSGIPFYNFPYTLGFLLSAGIYARALEDGPSFEPRYVDLLRDTGRMSTEDLARRHLGVELAKPDFWESAVDLVMEDAREFLRLTE